MYRSLQSLSRTSILARQYFSFSVIKFNLPDLGEKIKQGTIKKLYIKQGDRVEQFQKLADVASDKQFTEITASDSGVIKKIHYQQEDVCQVGSLFLEIETSQGSHEGMQQNIQTTTAAKPTDMEEVPATTLSNNNGSSTSQQKLATPFVRGLIKKYNLNIDDIKGTGAEGRILEGDVMAAVQSKREPKRVPSIQFGKKTAAKAQEQQKATAKPSSSQSSTAQKPTPISTQQSTTTQKMTLFQKGMQKSMTIANTIPHLYYHEQYDLTECEKLRKTLKASHKKVTVMGLLIKTFSMALKKYPRMNATYNPQQNEFEYKIHHNHNISLAIDSPNGLVVPNIKNVQTLNLLSIQQQIQRLRQLSIDAKLTSNQLNNGTVCISNIGTIGGVMANPLILAPQVCIVAIGKLQTVPKWKNDQWVPRQVINVSFGCDHRIVDGATVARFSNQWKLLLENPYIAMAEMI